MTETVAAGHVVAADSAGDAAARQALEIGRRFQLYTGAGHDGGGERVLATALDAGGQPQQLSRVLAVGRLNCHELGLSERKRTVSSSPARSAVGSLAGTISRAIPTGCSHERSAPDSPTRTNVFTAFRYDSRQLCVVFQRARTSLAHRPRRGIP